MMAKRDADLTYSDKNEVIPHFVVPHVTPSPRVM